ISDSKGSKLVLASVYKRPRLRLTLQKVAKGEFETEEFPVEERADVRGWRAIGTKIQAVKLKEAVWLEPLEEEIPEPEEEAEEVTPEAEEMTPEEDLPEEDIPEDPSEEGGDTASADKPRLYPKKPASNENQLGLFE